MFRLTRAAAAALAFAAAVPASAILPQQGMWSIGSEANGKPGRGIQLDRQGGDYLVLTYIGYRPDGSSMFLQASGKLADGMFFSGDLIEYKNGRFMGGAARDGEVAQNAGLVSVKFDTTSSGTVALPGEAPQKFSRYQYEDHIARLNHGFEYRSYRGNSRHYVQTAATIRAEPDRFTMSELTPTTSGTTECRYTGDLRPSGESFTSSGTVACSAPASTAATPFRYELVDLKVDERGMFSARLYVSSMSANPLEQPVELKHFQGVCSTSNPEFADGSKSRCAPNELGIGAYTPADWISPAWIPVP